METIALHAETWLLFRKSPFAPVGFACLQKKSFSIKEECPFEALFLLLYLFFTLKVSEKG